MNRTQLSAKLKFLVSLTSLLSLGCQLPSATTPRTPVELSDAQFAEYWRQLERRWPAYYAKRCVEPPTLPAMEDVRAFIRTIHEVPVPYMPDDAACTFGGHTMTIRADKWESGCVPHEMGHAAAKFLGNTRGELDWRVFEHRGACECD